MRILITSNLYPPHYLGGYELLCKQVVDALMARGHEVTVLTSMHEAGDCVEVQGKGRVRRHLELDVPFDQPGSVARGMRMRVGRWNAAVMGRILDEERPDLVFMWSQLRLTMACAHTARARRFPLAFTLNDDHLASYAPRAFTLAPKGLFRFITDRTLFRSTTLAGLPLDNATCISECLKTGLTNLGCPVRETKVIYQGIPVDEFPLKENPGSMHKPLRLLYVGQLHPYKGVHTILQALHILGGAGISASIVGDGPESYKARLRQEAQGLYNVHFLGKRPHSELGALYRDHDLFVFPSVWKEPFGLTHLEAMASGTPVVSTAEGGQGEFLEHDVNSLLFEKEDPVDLASCIRRLARDPALTRQLAVKGRRIVEEHFNLKRYVDDIETFLCSIVQAGATGHERAAS